MASKESPQRAALPWSHSDPLPLQVGQFSFLMTWCQPEPEALLLYVTPTVPSAPASFSFLTANCSLGSTLWVGEPYVLVFPIK